ncbi:MAG: tyrosine-type recombinase/integrase [Solirubrobacterales bacterium]
MAKRKHGAGTVKEKNGSIFIGFRPAPGAKQVWEKVGRVDQGTTTADAEALLEDRRVEARKGLIPRTRLVLEEVATKWREERAFEELAPKTREADATALDCHLLPAFGLDYLDTITPDLLRRYISKKLTFPPGHPKAAPVAGKVASARTKPLGTTAVRQQIQTLNKIFEWALDNGKAVSNPCLRVDKSSLKPSLSEVDVFEIEEVKALLKAAANEEERTILLVMAACGLRIGEVFGLNTSDYDQKTRTLHIQRTIQRDGGSTKLGNKTKTHSGDRYLVLEPSVGELVDSQIRRVKKKARNRQGLLFPNRVGNLRCAGNFRSRDWTRLLRKAGISEDRTPHALRHTFASELIQARKSDTDIASKMGHKNAQITRTIYAKTFARTKATEAGVAGLYLNDD